MIEFGSANSKIKEGARGIIKPLGTAPTSASASGIAGEEITTATHIYRCIATNSWRRVAIATWS